MAVNPCPSRPNARITNWNCWSGAIRGVWRKQGDISSDNKGSSKCTHTQQPLVALYGPPCIAPHAAYSKIMRDDRRPPATTLTRHRAAPARRCSCLRAHPHESCHQVAGSGVVSHRHGGSHTHGTTRSGPHGSRRDPSMCSASCTS